MKRLFLFLLTLTLLLSAAACTPKAPVSTGDPTTDAPSATTAPHALTATEAVTLLDTLVKKEHATVGLSVTTVTDGITLCSAYTASSTEVRFSVEKLSLFPTDGDFSNLPENFITTLTGTATVQNGKITAIDGDGATLPDAGTLQGKFAFPASALRNVVWENQTLTADVTDSAAVLGTANLTNARVSAVLSTDAITSLTVTYSTSKSNVTMVYTFG